MSLFGRMSKSDRDAVLAEERRKAQAEQAFQAVLTAYGELVRDPRYRIVRENMTDVLARILDDLVNTASNCAHCHAKAAPVKFLREVVDYPLAAAYAERQEARRREVEQAGTEGNGAG